MAVDVFLGRAGPNGIVGMDDRSGRVCHQGQVRDVAAIIGQERLVPPPPQLVVQGGEDRIVPPPGLEKERENNVQGGRT